MRDAISPFARLSAKTPEGFYTPTRCPDGPHPSPHYRKQKKAARPEPLHVICTGRNANDKLIEAADLVSEIREIKHPYKKGILAQRGIEY